MNFDKFDTSGTSKFNDAHGYSSIDIKIDDLEPTNYAKTDDYFFPLTAPIALLK